MLCVEFPQKIRGFCEGDRVQLIVDDPKYAPSLKLMFDNIEGKVTVDGCEASIEAKDVRKWITFDLLGFGYLPNESSDNVLFDLNQDLYDEIADKGRSILDEFGRKESWYSILDRFEIPIPTILNNVW